MAYLGGDRMKNVQGSPAAWGSAQRDPTLWRERVGSRTQGSTQPSVRRTSGVLDERAVVQLGGRLFQLRPGVHHDRPVPRDRLLNRLTGDQKEANAFLPGLNRYFVAAIKYDEGAVSRS